MFRPVKLFRVTIQAPEEYMSKVLGVLGDFKILHLVNINKTQLGRLGYVAGVDTELLKRYETILNKTNELIKELEISDQRPALKKAPRPEKDIFLLEKELEKIEEKAGDILKKDKIIRDELARKEELLERLKLLLPAELDFTRLSKLYFVKAFFGLLPTSNLPKLRESLSDIHHAIIKIKEQKDRIIIAAFCLKEDLPIMDRALKSTFFQEIELPKDLTGKVSELINKIELEIAPLREKKEEIQRERIGLRKEFSSPLIILREKAIIATILLKARAKFGKIDHLYLITGWLPVNLFDSLKKKLEEVTDGNVIIDKVCPEEIKEVREGIIKIPILFNNPMLIRPFEKLTTLYGIPSYEEVEPTVFLAISFVMLFGMMFGDLGHGLVLFLVGLFIFRRLYKYMDYGIILMECGVSSMFFGLMYGSVFGLEDLIPSLWLNPMKDINKFMLYTTLLGILIISLGFVLNLINILRRKEYEKLLSASGLSGALLYWLLAGLFLRYMFTGLPSPFELWIAKIISGILIFIIIIERPIRAFLAKKKKQKANVNLAIVTLESLIETADSIIRFIANTVSFIRVAAFALTHAALFMGVFSIANMLSQGGKGIGYVITLIIGNLVIILLEGMVVSIQTIRLEYYEFFSKFFRGSGEPFKPLITSEFGKETS